MIRYQFSGEEIASTPTTPALDDGDWLAGVARCFAGAALAAGLLTNTLAAQLSQGYQELDDGSSIGALHANPALDEDGAAQVASPRLWLTNGLVLWGEGDDDLGALHLTPSTDQDTWANPEPPALWPIPPVLPFTTDGDWAPAPAASIVEEDPAPVELPTCVWGTSARAILDEGNDLGNLHANPAVDEDYWQNPTQPALWPTNGLLLWGDAGEIAYTAPPLFADEDLGAPIPAPQLWPTTARPFAADDEPVPTISIDEEWRPAAPWPSIRGTLPQLDDGNDLPASIASLVEDDSPPVGRSVATWSIAARAILDDGGELGSLHLNPAVDEDAIPVAVGAGAWWPGARVLLWDEGAWAAPGRALVLRVRIDERPEFLVTIAEQPSFRVGIERRPRFEITIGDSR